MEEIIGYREALSAGRGGPYLPDGYVCVAGEFEDPEYPRAQLPTADGRRVPSTCHTTLGFGVRDDRRTKLATLRRIAEIVGGPPRRMSVHLPNRTLVEFYPQRNLYRVWVDGLPVFEYSDGRVCDDAEALADSLLD